MSEQSEHLPREGRRPRDDAGMTLIEVIAAMVVFAIAAVSIVALLGTGLKVDQQWVKVTDRGGLRVAVEGPNGDLYIATDASPGEIFRVHPTG